MINKKQFITDNKTEKEIRKQKKLDRLSGLYAMKGSRKSKKCNA